MHQRKAGDTVGWLSLALVLWAVSGSGLAADEGENVAVPDPDSLVYDTPEATELDAADAETVLLALSGEEQGVRVSPAPGNAPVEQDLSELAQAAEQYQEAIREQEAQGAWAPGLSQDLMGLGRALQEMGEHQEAIPVFERAGHVARVNRGLYTLDQLPALEERIDSHLALGQWEEADQQQQYSFYLYSRAMGQNDPALVEVMRDFAHWNLSVHFRGMEETSGRLLDAYRLFNAAHELLLQVESDNLERQLAYLDSLAGVAWLVARTRLSNDPTSLRGNRAFSETRMVNFRGGTRATYQVNGFSQGEAALQRAVDLQRRRAEQGVGGVLEIAEALARLGDWYLMFDRRRASIEAYRQAWDLLQVSDTARPADLFDEVRILPRFTNFPEQRRLAMPGPPEAVERGYVDVRLDANRYGRARDVEVIGGDPVTIDEVESRVARDLSSMRLRPRLENGEPVDAEDVIVRLPYWY